MFTIEELRNKVISLGKKYPDAIYNIGDSIVCYYNKKPVKNGPEEEGCIFGQAARSLGVFLPDEGGIDEVLSSMFGPDTIEDNHAVIDKFVTCQQMQDHGYTWGEAIKVLL